jgi:hypothetical protein
MADTGADAADMKTQVAAYKTSMTALVKKVMPMGGFWWQLMDGGGNKLAGKKTSAAQCKSVLAGMCTEKPDFWNKMAMYNIGHGGKGLQEEDLKQYTAEFMLTRGPYAMLGYSWYGCTGSAMHHPARALDRRAYWIAVPKELRARRVNRYGCTGSAMHGGGASPDPPRATEWDVDFGTPGAACHETSAGSGVYHLRDISISIGNLDWLRFACVLRCRY